MRKNELMGAKEAAVFLRLNEQTIRRLAREGKIPANRIGGSWRFSEDALMQWRGKTAADSAPPPAPVPPGHPRILVVDDDESIRSMVERTLVRCGYDVRTASGGAEALQEMERCLPDMVLLDLYMDDMNGKEVLSRIRAEWGYLPVAIITACPDSDLMQAALTLSPVTLLSKPFSREQLIATVHHTLADHPHEAH